MAEFEELFRQSYWRAVKTVQGHRGFFDRFYEQFLASSPDVEEKFRDTDMEGQKLALEESLVLVASFLTDPQADEHMERIARIHSRKERDIKPHLYDLWLECLVKTAKQYDPAFAEETELAWRMTLSPGIAYMKFKYDR